MYDRCDFTLIGHVALAAVHTEATNQALTDDCLDGACDEKRFDTHVEQARQASGGVVGVEGRENKVPGQGSLNAKIRGLCITHLSYHYDVWVLAKERTEAIGEGHPGFGVGLSLVDTEDLVLDRIFDG